MGLGAEPSQEPGEEGAVGKAERPWCLWEMWTDTDLGQVFPIRDFPDSSVAKESSCNAGDAGSIPGLGRSPEEGIGYLPQYSSASHVAHLVKNLPAMQETWVQSLHWEDPLEKGRATHSSILAWRIPWTIQSMGSQRVGHDWATYVHMLSKRCISNLTQLLLGLVIIKSSYQRRTFIFLLTLLTFDKGMILRQHQLIYEWNNTITLSLRENRDIIG